MGLGTRQTSALDCIPHDPSMLDNSMEDYTLATDNTSYEKEDLDTITVPLAAVGNMNASGEGAGGTVITPPSKSPEVSTTPEAGETDDPTKTPEAGETDDPTKTPEAGETDDPTKTPEVGETDNPDKTPEASTTPEPGTTSGSAVTDGGVSTKMVVNFGAEKSSPQLAAKTLKLEAEGHNGTGEYTYEFAIDDTVVQEASKTATYEWNPTKGTHTIQVTMTDENGNKVVSKKSYNIVGDGEDIVEPTDEVPTTSNPAEVTPTPSDNSTPEPSENVTTTPEGTTSTPTVTPDNTVTEVPSVDNTVTATPDPAGANTTATPEPAATNATATPVPATDATATPAPQQQLALKLKLSKAAPQKVGTSISIEANAAGGTGAYTYRYTVSLDNGYTKVLANNTDKNTVTWQPTKAGIYTISVVVMDTAGARVEKTAKYQITASKLAITKVKVNKKTIKVKKNVKFTVSGTAKSGKLKVQFTVTKSGKVVATRKYATKKTFTWKPKTKGTYKLLIQAKDSSGKVVKKTVKVTVK